MISRSPLHRCAVLALLGATLAITGCAAKLPKLAVCDGKHRRDANPYGSVLPGAPSAPSAAPRPDKGDSVPAAPALPPAETSSRALPRGEASC